MTLKFIYTPGYSSDTGCRLIYLDHRNTAELKKHLQSQTSECTSAEIVRKEYERLETFNDIHYGQYLSKVPALPVDGTPEQVKQWAVTASEAMKAAEKSVKDLMASINTMDKWKVAGLTAYLTENSPMRMLEEVGSFNHLNTSTIVTVSDSGAFRTFERVNGNLTKVNRLPGWARGWRLQTGGRNEIAYKRDGFFPKGTYEKRKNTERDADKNEPRSKKRWNREQR